MQMAVMLYQILTQIITQIMTMMTMPIFWAVAVLLAVQVGLIQIKKQKQVVVKLSAFLFAVAECWVYIIISGIVGGVIASSLLLLTGISVSYRVMLYLWIAMFGLFLLQRRFFCFAYAGGFFVFVQTIADGCGISLFVFDSKALLMLVAILHFTEAVLVRLSGALQQIPVYFRNKKGNLTAKTQLQMCWPVPLAIPMPVVQNNITEIYSGYFVMPDWWPLFGLVENVEAIAIYQLIPVLAMIGYMDIAEPGAESEQTRKSSMLLLIYSIVLCILTLAVSDRLYLQGIAALFAILGHEGMLWLGRTDMRKYVHTKKEQGFAKFIIKKR